MRRHCKQLLMSLKRYHLTLVTVVQAEEFKQLMQQVTKAQTADLEAIQKTQRVRLGLLHYSAATDTCSNQESCALVLLPKLQLLRSMSLTVPETYQINKLLSFLLRVSGLRYTCKLDKSLCHSQQSFVTSIRSRLHVSDSTIRFGGETFGNNRRW